MRYTRFSPSIANGRSDCITSTKSRISNNNAI